jgi:predicted transcriptional regulator
VDEPIHVTEAESELLEALWRCGPLPPALLFEEVRRRRPWGTATIKTLLARLIHKHAIRTGRQGGRLAYHPALDRETFIAAEVDGLVNRLFGGDRSKLALFLQARDAERD